MAHEITFQIAFKGNNSSGKLWLKFTPFFYHDHSRGICIHLELIKSFPGWKNKTALQ